MAHWPGSDPGLVCIFCRQATEVITVRLPWSLWQAMQTALGSDAFQGPCRVGVCYDHVRCRESWLASLDHADDCLIG